MVVAYTPIVYVTPTFGTANITDGVTKVFDCPYGIIPLRSLSGRGGYYVYALSGICADGTVLGIVGDSSNGSPVNGGDCPEGLTGGIVKFQDNVDSQSLKDVEQN